MLDLVGKKYGGKKYVPGFLAQDVLRIGSIGAGGLALPELLRAEKLQKIGSSDKSVIMVYMAGAPPHQDLIDPKPNAPKEVRSAFGPIRTNVTGIHLNESLPMLAKVMNKWTGIRTMVGAPSGSHDSFMCYTGRAGSAFSIVLTPSHRAIGLAWALPCPSWRVRAGGACHLSLALPPRPVIRPMVRLESRVFWEPPMVRFVRPVRLRPT